MAEWHNRTEVETDPLAPDWNATVNGTATPAWIESPKLTTSAAVKASILAAMAVVLLAGNSTTLYSIGANKKGANSTQYALLFQLAISDLLVSIVCLFGEAAWTYTVEWKGGQLLCKMFKFSQVGLG